jgi:hypothetical protein
LQRLHCGKYVNEYSHIKHDLGAQFTGEIFQKVDALEISTFMISF